MSGQAPVSLPTSSDAAHMTYVCIVGYVQLEKIYIISQGIRVHD